MTFPDNPASRSLLLKVMSAALTKNFEKPMSKMDPYATVYWVYSSTYNGGSAYSNSNTHATTSSSSAKIKGGASLRAAGESFLRKQLSKKTGKQHPPHAGTSHTSSERGITISQEPPSPNAQKDGYQRQFLGRTQTHWNAHMHPEWNYTCLSHPLNPQHLHSKGDSIEVCLWEENKVRGDVFMGSAMVPVSHVLGEWEDAAPVTTLQLTLPDGKSTGTVQVQAVVADLTSRSVSKLTGSFETEDPSIAGSASTASAVSPNSPGSIVMPDYSKVDPSLFHLPVHRLGVSGGTAPFFQLTLQNPAPGQRPSHYIGKDLSRATDEIAFYEGILLLKQIRTNAHLRLLLQDFAFEYAGVLEAPEANVPPGSPNLQLLVLRNLRDGCEQLRLLDLKMGQKTASAGWQGKSWSHAFRQGLFDHMTNSSTEGYRLEGFDGQPPALESMDPLLDLDVTALPGGRGDPEKVAKKARRVMLQSMSGADILMHFLDLHQAPAAGGSSRNSHEVDLHVEYHAVELVELVLFELVRRLTRLAVMCHKLTVSQKWVGSSVALGFDAGSKPSRHTTSDLDIRNQVLVHVFDWGRSELNTVEREEHMTAAEQQDRNNFWAYYKGGMDRLAFVAACKYYHQFCNSWGWEEVTITILDFDSIGKDDVLGHVTLPLQETEWKEVALMVGTRGSKSASEIAMAVPTTGATLTYSMSYTSCHASARVQGWWNLHILKAENLPNRDHAPMGSVGVSDPYCLVAAGAKVPQNVSESPSRSSNVRRVGFEQVTSVKPNTLHPEWNETLFLPIVESHPAGSFELFRQALDDGGAELGRGTGEDGLASLFPLDERRFSAPTPKSLMKKGGNNPGQGGFPKWVERVKACEVPPVPIRPLSKT